MNYSELSTMMIMHFIIAALIMMMVAFVLSTIKIDNIAYLGVLLGLYVFSCYGVDRSVEDSIIENNYQRFVLAIISIIIFDLFFVYFMPFIFNMDIFGLVKLGENLVLDSQMIFAVFSAIVLMANYFSYR